MAFKKPCQKVKTSAPIKTSERKKMKQQVIESFSLAPEEGDLLVPDPILYFKFDTHVKQPGVVYTSVEGDPLWFSLGKGASDLIPTVYTLWKKPNLLPILSTPSSVIPKLANGADLMMPGVLKKPSDVKKNDLVSVTAHTYDPELVGPPLAVGRMALDSSDIARDKEGKGVNILHVFEDHLWLMGSKSTPPEPAPVIPIPTTVPSNETASVPVPEAGTSDPQDGTVVALDTPENADEAAVNDVPSTSDSPKDSLQTLSPEEVTSLLRMSTIQAIHSQLSTLPPASFPIPSSLLYSSYILPYRPVTVLKFGTPVDIKHSSHKNLTSFLKSLEKDGLLKLKDFKGDLNILSVQNTHPEVLQCKPYRTIGDKEKSEEKRAADEKLKQEKVKEMLVRELWVPSSSTIRFFERNGKNTKEFYAVEELRIIVNEYITQHSLVNQNDQRYINLDETLRQIIPASAEGPAQFLKRADIVKHLCEGMDPWHEITIDGKEPVRRKGPVKPIEIICKIGHRTTTSIKFFEPFFVSPEFLSSELRRICSASTDITTGGKEGPIVKVQGKQIKLIVDLLVLQGIPKRCIEASETQQKKK